VLITFCSTGYGSPTAFAISIFLLRLINSGGKIQFNVISPISLFEAVRTGACKV